LALNGGEKYLIITVTMQLIREGRRYMKIIVAGSRDICRYRAYYEYHKILLEHLPGRVSELVTGEAKGPDQVPHMVNEIYPQLVPIKSFAAEWGKYGRSAGPRRNKEMADYADGLILIWDGKSRGSLNMKKCMERLNKPIWEVICQS
jgi:hypothetical protein